MNTRKPPREAELRPLPPDLLEALALLALDLAEHDEHEDHKNDSPLSVSSGR
jgi:hypothetical protein